ncbi:hypothetical protein D3C74_387480 [compost metagenome]
MLHSFFVGYFITFIFKKRSHYNGYNQTAHSRNEAGYHHIAQIQLKATCSSNRIRVRGNDISGLTST